MESLPHGRVGSIDSTTTSGLRRTGLAAGGLAGRTGARRDERPSALLRTDGVSERLCERAAFLAVRLPTTLEAALPVAAALGVRRPLTLPGRDAGALGLCLREKLLPLWIDPESIDSRRRAFRPLARRSLSACWRCRSRSSASWYAC